MSIHVLQDYEVLPVGVLLAVIVVCLLLMLLSKKPDPKMCLQSGLMCDSSHEVDRETPNTGKQADIERRRSTGAVDPWGHFLAAYLEARFGAPVLWEVGGSFAPD
jgi:hypothetical protein